MQKKVLTEQALYYGNVNMPKDWHIDSDKLSQDILQSSFTNRQFPFSKNWDRLNTYIRDYIRVEHDISLFNKNSWGDIYKPNQTSKLLLNVDLVDLINCTSAKSSIMSGTCEPIPSFLSLQRSLLHNGAIAFVVVRFTGLGVL